MYKNALHASSSQLKCDAFRELRPIALAPNRSRLESPQTSLRLPRAETESEALTAYDKLWKEFGKAIKMGIVEDSSNRNRLAKLLRVFTSKSPDKLVSLEKYVARMKPDQKHIYFIAGALPDRSLSWRCTSASINAAMPVRQMRLHPVDPCDCRVLASLAVQLCHDTLAPVPTRRAE